MLIDLVVVRGPQTIVLTVDSDAAFLDGAPSVVRCPTSEAYDRIHSANNIVASSIVTDEVGPITHAFAAMRHNNQGSGLGGPNQA